MRGRLWKWPDPTTHRSVPRKRPCVPCSLVDLRHPRFIPSSANGAKPTEHQGNGRYKGIQHGIALRAVGSVCKIASVLAEVLANAALIVHASFAAVCSSPVGGSHCAARLRSRQSACSRTHDDRLLATHLWSGSSSGRARVSAMRLPMPYALSDPTDPARVGGSP